MVNVLGCERSEPGFESRRPESDFTPTHQKYGGKISSTPAATSTAHSDNHSGPGPTTTTITHYHGHLTMLISCPESCPGIWLWAGLFWQREGYMCGFFSLILKPHLWNHFSIESRLRWRVDKTIIRLAWDANIAVSSANVATIISVDTGKSAV